jgi:beta-hydroxylase
MLDKNSLAYKIKKTLGIGIIRITEALLSLVDNRVWMDKKDYDYTRVLEANATAIRDEFLQVQDRILNIEKLFPESQVNVRDDNWKTFFLIAYGHDLVGHLESCPVTAASLAQIPFATSALFSVLEPHRTIPMHRGEYKGMLRCHLALIIPDSERCYIVVNDMKRHWVEGECLFFDDTFPHYAVNESDRRRVVLFIDILRQYPFPFNYLNYFIFRQISKSEFIHEVLVRSEQLDGVQSRPRPLNYL